MHGSVHTSTPDAISHLGFLHNIEFQGKLDGAEKMYQRAIIRERGGPPITGRISF
jgi:hypothetical protein